MADLKKRSKTAASKAGEELVDRLVRGVLRPGERIVETSAASELGVSRTPLREALQDLRRLGLVANETDKGYRVVELTAREAREVYPLIWTLESMSLSSLGPIGLEYVQSLRQINSDFAAALARQDAEAALHLDTLWHENLVSPCRNRRLVSMLRDLKTIALRYEFEFMASSSLPSNSVREHKEIADYLEAGRLEEAEVSLTLHWRKGMELLLNNLDWL